MRNKSFFKQPLTCILTISSAYLVMITTVSEKRDINGVSATSHIPSTFLRTTTPAFEIAGADNPAAIKFKRPAVI